MSENKGAKNTEKPGFFTRAKNWIVALPGRISDAFKNMVAELKKVAWPSKKDLINYSYRRHRVCRGAGDRRRSAGYRFLVPGQEAH